MAAQEILQLSLLEGSEIVRWVGTEMAIVGGGQSNVWSESDGCWTVEDEAVEWSHPSVPFLQLTNLDIQLANGKTLRLLSQLDDGSEFNGLYLVEIETVSDSNSQAESSIFRTREIVELPVGPSKVTVLRQSGPSAIVEANISITSHTIRLLAAEVHPRTDGKFDIVEGDESILIQLDGARPNQSVNGTPNCGAVGFPPLRSGARYAQR
jgi:hypothetical protein